MVNGAQLPEGLCACQLLAFLHRHHTGGGSRSDSELGNKERKSMCYLVACRERCIQSQSCWNIVKGLNEGPSGWQKAILYSK